VYVVATTHGIETNIGKDRGKMYFGVNFETMSKQFDRDIYGTLAHLAKWVSEIDFKLPRATEAVEKGRVLLVAANLECLLHIIHGTSNKAQFETYLRSL
jgi:phage-related tail protein